MAIGRLMRKNDAQVIIDNGDQCLSACVLLLIAGTERIVSGQVAIHRPYLIGGSGNIEQVRDSRQAITEKLSAYVKEMNVSTRIVDDMMGSSPDAPKFLSFQQLFDYGIRDVDPVADEEANLALAKSHGISQTDLIARRASARLRCSAGLPANNFLAELQLKMSLCYLNIVWGDQKAIFPP